VFSRATLRHVVLTMRWLVLMVHRRARVINWSAITPASAPSRVPVISSPRIAALEIE